MVKRSKADIALELKSDEQLQPTKKLRKARGPNKKHDAGHDSGTHVATKQARASKKKPAVASQSISAMLSKSVAPVGTGTPDNDSDAAVASPRMHDEDAGTELAAVAERAVRELRREGSGASSTPLEVFLMCLYTLSKPCMFGLICFRAGWWSHRS